MAGSALKLDYRYDDRQVLRAMRRLQEVAGNLRPALVNIGELLVRSTEDRFRDQQDPEGSSWAPLSAATLKRKKGNKILTESRRLRDSIVYHAAGDALQVGTNVVYAAVHQFGSGAEPAKIPAHERLVKQAFGKQLRYPVWARVKGFSRQQNIPARPFLGVSADDREQILEILQDHIEMALTR